ncbi:MAG: PhoPQ-activated pathogenicity-related family protein [Planctomycetaceae bacterium]
MLRVSWLARAVALCVTLVCAWSAPVRAESPAFTPPTAEERTALDEYIAKPDPSYSWRLGGMKEAKDHTVYAIELTSQTWRTAEEVDRPVWKHWVMIVKPKVVTSKTGFLFIGGGSHRENAPDSVDSNALAIAMASKTVVAELKNVPNQPLVFKEAGRPMVEDDLIAFTWKKYMETKDKEWPARLPMVKSAVRAMDCVQEFLASEAGGKVNIEKFMVAGGSKRGWTTWCTAAVDPRVVAISPIVIDTLRLNRSARHHLEAYGFWAPAISEYIDHKIPLHEDEPAYLDLLKIEDPYSYRKRFTMPKYVLNAAGDQFFLPDNSQFYYSELPEEKLLRYVPNTDHGLGGSDALQSLIAFYETVVNGTKRPEYSWKNLENGAIRVETKTTPTEVKLWHAHNPDARDFRLEEIGRAYKSQDLKPTEPGVYIGQIEPHKKGFMAYFVELTYDVGASFPLKVTTEIRVTPNEYPFKGMKASDAKVGGVPKQLREKKKD